MFDRFDDPARKVMGLARQEAQRFNHQYIGTEHILLGLIHGKKVAKTVAGAILRNLGVEAQAIRRQVEEIVQNGPAVVTLGQIPFTPRAKRVLELTIEESELLQHEYIGTEHLLLGLIRENEGVAAQVLTNLGLNLGDVREEVLELLGGDLSILKPEVKKKARKKSRTPAFNAFSRDLVALAQEGALPTVVGRDAEVGEVIATLGRMDHANALVIGAEGVGRRAVVHGLAHAIARGEVPASLRDARIMELDLPSLIAGTRWRGALEERVAALCTESKREQGEVLVYVDEAEPFLNWPFPRGDDKVPFFETFLPAIDRGEVRVILRVDDAQYAEHIASDAKIARRFDLVRVGPPTAALLAEILRQRRGALEEHHRVRIDDEALEVAADRPSPWPGVEQPAAALKLLDAACALVGQHQGAAEVEAVGPDQVEVAHQRLTQARG